MIEGWPLLLGPGTPWGLLTLLAMLPTLPLAYAGEQSIKKVVITILDANDRRVKFYGELDLRIDYMNRHSFYFQGGSASESAVLLTKTEISCLKDPTCLASHGKLTMIVNPADFVQRKITFRLDKINATIEANVSDGVLHVYIKLPVVLGLVKFCAYTTKKTPLPGAKVTIAGTTESTGKDGCTAPLLVEADWKATIHWGGVGTSLILNKTDIESGIVNATLPIPFGEKFNLTIVSRDGKPLVVFVQYPGPNLPKLFNGTCSFTLSDIGRAVIFFEGICTPLTLDKIVNGTFFVLNTKAKPLKLCVYSDNGTPLTFYLDIRASCSSGFIITGSGQLSGKGCRTFYFPSIPEQLNAWASYRWGRYHLAKPFKVSVPGGYTIHLDITPPVIDRVWINATWTTMYGTKCLDMLLYVHVYDPNKWASGVKEVRAGFSKDFYDLGRGDYLGSNTWRFELGCPRRTGAIRTVYVAAVDKSGNRAMMNFTYRVEPGVKWLLGKPPEPAKSTHTKGPSETKTTEASIAATASMSTPTSIASTKAIAQATVSAAISETAGRDGEGAVRVALPAIAAIVLLAVALILRKKA